MVFYLGNKVEGLVADKVRNLRNKTKSWTYGYNETIDTVIISKDGTQKYTVLKGLILDFLKA
jgi:hypothetical protein